MKKILILCTGNSCRSQMAHGFLESLTDFQIFSAGTKPEPVNKYAAEVMKELDINISSNRNNDLMVELDKRIKKLKNISYFLIALLGVTIIFLYLNLSLIHI